MNTYTLHVHTAGHGLVRHYQAMETERQDAHGSKGTKARDGFYNSIPTGINLRMKYFEVMPVLSKYDKCA